MHNTQNPRLRRGQSVTPPTETVEFSELPADHVLNRLFVSELELTPAVSAYGETESVEEHEAIMAKIAPDEELPEFDYVGTDEAWAAAMVSEIADLAGRREYPNVLVLVRDEQWIGSDADIVDAMKILSNVLAARAEAERCI